MNPDDDPEARIRELESSAAQYGAVELGAGQSGGAGSTPTSPLPPPLYGTPAPADPYMTPPIYGGPYMPVKRNGAPIGLIVGLSAAALVVVFGVIAVIAWTTVSNVESATTRPGGSSISGGGGPVDDVPSAGAPTTEAPVVAPGPPGDPEVLTGPPGVPLNISGVDEVETVACDGNTVNVSGVSNNVTVTGHCTALLVSGVENVIVVDSADTIRASGFDNRVIYRSGAPQIDATDSNIITQG